jgi:hypothetical protein
MYLQPLMVLLAVQSITLICLNVLHCLIVDFIDRELIGLSPVLNLHRHPEVDRDWETE